PGMETDPAFVGAAVLERQCLLAHRQVGLEVGGAAGSGELARRVGVGDVGVAAPGLPGGSDDLSGVVGQVGSSPVQNARPQGCVGDAGEPLVSGATVTVNRCAVPTAG